MEVITGGVDGPQGWPLYLDRYAALVKKAADMPAIVTSAGIDRPGAEVFAYATAVIESIFGN